MAKKSSEQVPLFAGLDLSDLHSVETVSEDQAEKYTFESVDFSDPKRPKTCLEVDFPILKVNEISAIEQNATKPIYMMSKWWARRRASVFRQLLLAASTKAPKDESLAAQLSWSLMYRKSHKKHGKFSHLKVVDIFMGGGTTIVEAARLGFQVTGIDLNPIAWWIVKNETTSVSPERVKAFARYIEDIVKPQLLPFYTASSPRGFEGKWIDKKTGKEVKFEIAKEKPQDRSKYTWVGPETIYTFWMKHVMCTDPECNHLTPSVSTPIVSQKSASVKYLENCVCPHCGDVFDLEFGDFRMAPSSKLELGINQTPFTTLDEGAN
jgi:adenine-specific DNA methylase